MKFLDMLGVILPNAILKLGMAHKRLRQCDFWQFSTYSHQLLVEHFLHIQTNLHCLSVFLGKLNCCAISNGFEPSNLFSAIMSDLFNKGIRFHHFAGKLPMFTQWCEVAKSGAAEFGNYDSKFAISLSNLPHNWLLCNLVSNFPTNFTMRYGKVMWNQQLL